MHLRIMSPRIVLFFLALALTTFAPNTARAGQLPGLQASGHPHRVTALAPDTTSPISLAILHSFHDGSVTNDGDAPVAALVQGTDGNFYGMTRAGGSSNDGTVFRMTPEGAVTILHSFADGSVTNDGTHPYVALVQGSDGNFYGTTYFGGSAGEGTVFQMTPEGAVTILHSFADGSVINDGNRPDAALVQGTDGNFYGTTNAGGYSGDGTVFEMTPAGTVTILHSFQNGSVPNGGSYPVSALVQGTDGNFYGTTGAGGSASAGTVFRMTYGGAVTILHNFADGSVTNDGKFPNAALVQGIDGNFYGITYEGGSAGEGTVFRMTPGSTVTILHSFYDGTVPDDGYSPEAALVQGADGNFYGTTYLGTVGNGTVFRITSAGAVTVLHSFQDGSVTNDGKFPGAALVQGTDGNFYGTTYEGGSAGDGTVFRFLPTPTITSISPTAGPVGSVVTIAGANFSNVSRVRFHNADATYMVNSSTQITCTVPSGAGTGTITVNEPGGTVISAQTFTVLVPPTITSISPTSGPIGTRVTITGTNFSNVSRVRFHNADATYTVNSSTKITCTVPTGAGTGTITINEPSGTVISSQTFTVIPAPAITSFTPTSGPVGTVVTITGTNLGSVTKVRFHNAYAATFSASADGTQITCTVPSGTGTGTITVTTLGGSVTSAQTYTLMH